MDIFGVQSVDTIGRCTTSYLLAGPRVCNALFDEGANMLCTNEAIEVQNCVWA